MDVSTPTVTPLRQRMVEDMRMRKFEPKTQSAYLRAVRKLAAFLKAPPDTATVEDLRRFQMQLVDGGASPITLNATISGLKMLASISSTQGLLSAARTACISAGRIQAVLVGSSARRWARAPGAARLR